MVSPVRAAAVFGYASAMAAVLSAAPQQPKPVPTPQPGPTAHAPAEFVGVWAYNPEESVNAATGKPERAPRVAAARVPAGRPVGSPADTGMVSAPGDLGGRGGSLGPASPGFGAGGAGGPIGGSVGPVGATVAMVQENRSLTRDLLEVPETLTVKVDPQTVTFIDDLDRARVYPTTGERRRYQLGAARFHAAAAWAGSTFEKKIDAIDGFRMTEVYFLSENGRRMFVILRVGSTRKGAPVMGVNRVYDRVDP